MKTTKASQSKKIFTQPISRQTVKDYFILIMAQPPFHRSSETVTAQHALPVNELPAKKHTFLPDGQSHKLCNSLHASTRKTQALEAGVALGLAFLATDERSVPTA
jgi:hypothetical protein